MPYTNASFAPRMLSEELMNGTRTAFFPSAFPIGGVSSPSPLGKATPG